MGPRKCWSVARLTDRARDGYMLVEIHPPVIGQPYGLGDEDIFFILLSSKWQGYSIFPVSHWPCTVYVIRVLDDHVLGVSSFETRQVEMMSWDTIFPTLAQAEASALALRRAGGER
jgi:hypothetical protein